VIVMKMADHDVLDWFGAEGLADLGDDLLRDGIVEDRVEHDNGITGIDEVSAIRSAAEVTDLVDVLADPLGDDGLRRNLRVRRRNLEPRGVRGRVDLDVAHREIEILLTATIRGRALKKRDAVDDLPL